MAAMASSCRRAAAGAASTRLPTVAMLLLIFSLLLALDRPAVADARHVKSSPSAAMADAAGSSSRINGGSQADSSKTKKLDAGKTKRPFMGAVEVNAAPNKGSGEGGEQQSFGSSSIGNGGSTAGGAVESADKMVVVQRRGPTPHPKKHN